MKNYSLLTTEIRDNLKKLQQEMPEVMQGFMAMHKVANQDGALSEKNKELIATAIAVAMRCDDCISMHMKRLVQLKVTRAEILEMLSVAIYTGGGASLMYATHALDAFEEFEAKPKND